MITGAILAAGSGRRFTGPTSKLATPFRAGAPVLHWSIRAALEAAAAGALDEVVVVVADPAVVLPDGDFVVTVNPDPADGLASSLAVAVDASATAGSEAVVVGLGDQPLVTAGAWCAVAASDSPIAVATYDGDPGHPVRLDRSVWPELPRHGDRGARDLLRLRPDLVCEIPCEGSAADIDTVEDLARWS